MSRLGVSLNSIPADCSCRVGVLNMAAVKPFLNVWKLDDDFICNAQTQEMN